MNYGIKYWLINQCQQNPDSFFCSLFNNKIATFLGFLLFLIAISFWIYLLYKVFTTKSSLNDKLAVISIVTMIFSVLAYLVTKIDFLMWVFGASFVSIFIFGRDLMKDDKEDKK